jgi:hypothetical protein
MPKLSLRDLFAVVTIVALALGWWLDRSRLAAENRMLEDLYRAGLMQHLEAQKSRDFANQVIKDLERQLGEYRDQTSHPK